MVLSLYPRDDLARDMDVSPHGEGFAGITIAYNVRTKEEVAEILAQFEAAGGRIVRHAFTAEWGGTIGFAADVDGHVWEIAHNPQSPLQPDGSFRI
jgi:uncharacterized glyoxalase superfamily protein PhnB